MHSSLSSLSFRRRAFLSFLLFSAVLFLPALIVGGKGSDLLCQALWVKLFSAQLLHGDLYPRWLQDMYIGRGSPAFFYYPPLTYYLTALFTLLPGDDPTRYHAITASAFLATVVSGGSFYAWIRDEGRPRESALLGSLLYMGAPLHIAYCFYFVLLFSFVWAYAWLPLLMLGVRRAARGEACGIAILAGSFFLLVMTNLPLTLVAGPCVLLYGALHLRRPTLLAQSLRIGAGTALGFGMPAYYLLPAVSYIPYAIVKRQWTEPETDYHNFFITLDMGNWGNQLYLAAWCVMALLLLVYVLCVRPRSREFIFFAVLTAAALFMTLAVSRPLWDSMNIMKIIQFPQRFFVVAALGLAVLAALAAPRLHRLAYALLVLYVGVTCVTAAWPREPYPDFDLLLANNIEQHANYMTTYDIVPRYYTSDGVADAIANGRQVTVMSGDAQVTVKRWSPRHIVIGYHARQRSMLRVRQFYYPGFDAHQGGRLVRFGREGKTGEILLDVPPGDDDIHVDLEPLPPQTQGMQISVVSFVLFALLVLPGLRGAYLRRKAGSA